MPIQFSEGEIKTLNVSLQPIPIAPATLTGRVVDADTGLPISNVEITFTPSVGFGGLTGLDGYYSIGNIPPGSYAVRFFHADYETVEY